MNALVEAIIEELERNKPLEKVKRDVITVKAEGEGIKPLTFVITIEEEPKVEHLVVDCIKRAVGKVGVVLWETSRRLVVRTYDGERYTITWREKD